MYLLLLLPVFPVGLVVCRDATAAVPFGSSAMMKMTSRVRTLELFWWHEVGLCCILYNAEWVDCGQNFTALEMKVMTASLRARGPQPRVLQSLMADEADQ